MEVNFTGWIPFIVEAIAFFAGSGFAFWALFFIGAIKTNRGSRN